MYLHVLVNTKIVAKTNAYNEKRKRIMKKTIIRNEMRQSLKDNTIRLVAEDGLSNLTTKKVAQTSGLAEVYIYRYFESKTDLLEQCFQEVELKFGEKIKEIFIGNPEKDITVHAKKMWYGYWNYLIENRELVIFATRFYNSSFFTEEMLEFTRDNFKSLMKEIRSSNKGWTIENKEVIEKDLIIQYILNVTSGYAVKVLQGEIDDSEETVEFIFNRIISPILREVKIKYSE